MTLNGPQILREIKGASRLIVVFALDTRTTKRSNYSQKSRDREYSSNKKEKVLGDWSEHVSSSGKKYYYNSKTEVSQWEKPREWIERESRTSSKDARDRDNSHRDNKERERDYRDKDVRDREYRDKDRGGGGGGGGGGVGGGGGYSSRSHSNSRSRWPLHDSEPPPHKRRHEDNPDMDISPGDSTPTSETSYSHSSTPSANHPQSSSHVAAHNNNSSTNNNSNEGPILLASPLPRLASSCNNSSSSSSGPTMMTTTLNSSGNNHATHGKALQSSPKSAAPVTGNGQGDIMLSSNTPGPPVGGSPPVTLAGLPKILSQITGNKQIEQNDLIPQKALQTINNALARQHSVTQMSCGGALGPDRTLNSPLYASPHYNQSSISQLNFRNSDISNNLAGDAGPPTPTQELDMGETRRCKYTSLLDFFPGLIFYSIFDSS